MWNTGLDEVQAGIKIVGRNINNLRYADDTTLMAESEEELKSLLVKVKVESEKVGLKLNWRVKRVAEMCLQTGLSARAGRPCKRGILPKSMDTALSLMVPCKRGSIPFLW